MGAKATKVKKILGIIGNVLSYIFFAICIFALIISVSAKKDSDGAASLFGKQLRIVVSNSMEKCDQTDVSDYEIKDIPIKSLLIIDLVPEDGKKAKEWYDDLKVGDVLTFRYVYVKQETITHRITRIEPKEGGYLISLEGDNKASDADTIAQQIDTTLTDSPNYILGKVTGVSYAAGILLTAVKSPVGIICIIIIPCLIIMGFEIFRLVNILTERKRNIAKEKEEAREQELESLRQQLAALQGQSSQENGERREGANDEETDGNEREEDDMAAQRPGGSAD